MSRTPDLTTGFDRTSKARVATDKPARYGHQLVSHMGRTIETTWDQDTASGWLSFTREGPNIGVVEISCADSVLELCLSTTDEHLARLEHVTGIHLARFGQRDGLAVTWTRDDGTPGTVQGPLTLEDMERMRREREARQQSRQD